VPWLLGAVLFEASLLAGTHVASALRRGPAEPQAALLGSDSQLAQWRRKALGGSRDPALGRPAPELQMRTPGGEPVDAGGERTVVIFAPEGAG